MDVVLVGLPGSGKSAVGRRLAHRHGATFVDLDDVIEKAAGRTIPEIFADRGEAAFRALERQAVADLGTAHRGPDVRTVVATGGGAVIDPRNGWALYRGRVPVWLDVRPEVLAQRLRRSPNVRPLIVGRDPMGAIRDLVRDRDRFYSAAHRLNGVAELASIVERVDELVARVAGDPDPTILLRGHSLGGELVIGEGIAAKTLVGAFHPPAAVIIDIALLRSLPERQRRAALGEAAKMAALGDERLFALLEHDGAAIAAGDEAAVADGAVAELVERAAWAKVEVVDVDEKEQGAADGRITLNLGHSLGHAVEAAGGFGELLHGEAVAHGLRAAVRIGTVMGVTPAERAERIERLL